MPIHERVVLRFTAMIRDFVRTQSTAANNKIYFCGLDSVGVKLMQEVERVLANKGVWSRETEMEFRMARAALYGAFLRSQALEE
jgi:hypothetical protein